MSLKTLMLAFRTPLLVAAATLVAVAAPATALLGLPIGLPSAGHHVDTPVGSADVAAGEDGAAVCYDVATPDLPATPALPPLPVPVPLPAIPAVGAPKAASTACLSGGLDGASVDAGIDAAGSHIGAGTEVQAPVDAAEIDSTMQETAGEGSGFVEKLIERLFGWM